MTGCFRRSASDIIHREERDQAAPGDCMNTPMYVKPVQMKVTKRIGLTMSVAGLMLGSAWAD